MNIGLKIALSGIFVGVASLVAIGAYLEHTNKAPRWLVVSAAGSGLTVIFGGLIWIWTA